MKIKEGKERKTCANDGWRRRRILEEVIKEHVDKEEEMMRDKGEGW